MYKGSAMSRLASCDQLGADLAKEPSYSARDKICKYIFVYICICVCVSINPRLYHL